MDKHHGFASFDEDEAHRQLMFDDEETLGPVPNKYRVDIYYAVVLSSNSDKKRAKD